MFKKIVGSHIRLLSKRIVIMYKKGKLLVSILLFLGSIALFLGGIIGLWIGNEDSQFFGRIFLIFAFLVILLGIIILILRKKQLPVEREKTVKEKKEKQKKIEVEAIEKIRRIVKVSDRIEIDMMRESLGLNKKEFLDKLYVWAEQFNFRIDGNILVINKDTVSDFLEALDKQFDTWERREAGREGKV
jgi:MFS family permease